MSAIRAEELSNIEDYEQSRIGHRRRAIELRKLRRVQICDRVSLVFENRETILWQIQEAMRTEGITDPDTLQSECDVYASLLPTPSELSATLHIVTSPNGVARAELEELTGIVDHLSLIIDGESVTAREEPEAVMASVIHVRFVLNEDQRARFCDPDLSAAIRLTHPKVQGEAKMIVETRQLIAEDLK